MATQRKPAGRNRPARPAKKVAAASRSRSKPAAASKARPSAAKPAARPVAAKPAAKARPVVGKPAVKGVKGAPRSRPVPEVRPLGVLPPGSRARVSDRAPAPVAIRPHASTPKPTNQPTRHQGAQRVTEKDMKEFETRLLTERGRILKEMGHLENTVLKVNPRDSAGDLSGYSFHMADAGTDAMEREKAFLFASSEGRALIEINNALRRLYNGEYGTCESCGQPIARARLEAMPHARLCVTCKEKEERASRNAQ
jgi:DnaK suppressor protein